MAWQYVGGTSGAGTSTGYAVSLTGLTGGLASAPNAGDLVVVFSGFGNTASSAPNISGNNSGAYSPATAAQHVNDTWDTEFRSFYAVMGATPDTSLTVTRATNAAYGGATTVHVWRGVDTSNPFIGGATPASGANTSLVNPPAYNPAVTDALIIAGGAGTQATTGAAFTGFTGMSNFITRKGDGSTSDIDVAMASYLYAGVSYDPPVVSGGTGGNASSSWAGVTIAFRMAPPPNEGDLAATEAGSDTGSASGDVVVQGSGAATEVGDDTFAASGTVDPFPAMLVDDVEKFDFVGGPNPTISGISFGTPASDRIVVVFFQCAATPSAVTIGGVSATFVANLSGSDYYGIAWAAVPSSSSGSLVLTGGGGYGLFSGAFAVYGEGLPALDFAFVSGATSSDIDLAGGGVVVGAAITAGAISWTGVTEQAEYVGLTGSNTSLALNYETTYGAPATIQTSPAAITRLLSFGTALAEIVGTLSATESGDDTAAASGEVLVQGDTAATEAGDDTAAMAGDVFIAGTLAVTEAGADTASISGDVIVAGVGEATEAGQDMPALSGDVLVQGGVAAAESGQDVFAGSSAGSASGDMAAVESDDDRLDCEGSSQVEPSATNEIQPIGGAFNIPTRQQMRDMAQKQRIALGILPKPVQKKAKAAAKRIARIALDGGTAAQVQAALEVIPPAQRVDAMSAVQVSYAYYLAVQTQAQKEIARIQAQEQEIAEILAEIERTSIIQREEDDIAFLLMQVIMAE